MNNQKKLLEMFDALIDTAERLTDLDNVYNDKDGHEKDPAHSWGDIRKMREALAKLVNGEQPRFITWMRDRDHDSHTKQDAYNNGCFTINEGHTLEYWTTVANPFADMPHGYSMDLITELFIEGDYA